MNGHFTIKSNRAVVRECNETESKLNKKKKARKGYIFTKKRGFLCECTVQNINVLIDCIYFTVTRTNRPRLPV